MNVSRALIVVASLVVAPSALAQVQGPQVTRSRGLTSLAFEGTLPPALASSEALSVHLVRGDRSAEIGALKRDGSRFRVLVRTARLLTDGAYALEIRAPEASPLRHAFRLGDASSATRAAERMRSWYRGAASTFRALSAALERRGTFHKGLAIRDPEGAIVQQELFDGFLAAWRRNLRMARMDLATYQRRVLLPSSPQIGDALVELVPLLLERSAAWEKALQPFGRAPGPSMAVEAVAARLAEALGQPKDAVRAWQAGPLGDPPPVDPKPGAYRSPLGFTISVPEDAEFKAPRTPYDRLEFSVGGVTAIVRVEDRPDERTPEAWVQRLETDAWETWDSYKRLVSERLPDDAGLRLEFRALYRGQRVGVVQRSLFPIDGGTRVVSLLVFRADGAPKPEFLLALEESLSLGTGQ